MGIVEGHVGTGPAGQYLETIRFIDKPGVRGVAMRINIVLHDPG